MSINKVKFDSYRSELEAVIKNIEHVMVGKKQVSELSIVALLAGGHVLLEDVPGVGKTMMVRAIAKSLGLQFNRIQFTPDLLPSDITGVSIFNQKEMNFEFRAGPLMGNVILADEINRTSPKTQSALLESMEEKSITVDGHTHILPNPFFVMATQNPIEYEGTYPLPEAQLDRFLLKLNMGYPTPDEELSILSLIVQDHPIDNLKPVVTAEELNGMKEQVKAVYVDETVKKYIIDLVNRTRNHRSIYLGASPRGSLALMKAAQAHAFMMDRDFVVPDDVKYLAPYVLTHRILLKPEARFEGETPDTVIRDLLNRVPVPIQKGQHAR
ncbi:MoxR family ATPase [Fictibacillus sp. WQ 8-8]|uniref:MoxR family ATPase n=1 Tax=Fictibacillus marinisediminis TaxID=2878389 RepID=A0A9X1X7J6_9BACL|nr:MULTISPECIES: MoxR family ATPase [Fictibacillus]MCK6255336.1 MoxR family ATPase [Fictibacillus marinisediminis]MCQ6268261.1 MoxR family ATPase [Fictibacillus sp. WQ 8-8]MED2974756.1 MoxR family ATPase [Fictibacillus sp. B-59209]SFF06745.1 MoxR-like ATPase [Bacillus sp. OV194]